MPAVPEQLGRRILCVQSAWVHVLQTGCSTASTANQQLSFEVTAQKPGNVTITGEDGKQAGRE